VEELTVDTGVVPELPGPLIGIWEPGFSTAVPFVETIFIDPDP
jgi:hypothetical protein